MADLLSEYGVDLHDPANDTRPWPWLARLIWALLSAPRTRLFRMLVEPRLRKK